MAMDRVVAEARTSVRNLLESPKHFLSVHDGTFDQCKEVVKVLYDLAKSIETPRTTLKSARATTLRKLVIDDFDEEQVWAGVELQNKDKIKGFQNDVAKFMSRKRKLDLLTSSEKKDEAALKKVHFDDEDNPHQADDDEESSDSLSDDLRVADDKQEDQDEVEDEDPLNDPDFEHMSDSEGDDLPLFDKADSSESGTDEEEAPDDETVKKNRKSEKSYKADVNTKVSSCSGALADIRSRIEPRAP